MDFSVNSLLEQMAESLAKGERIEVRGFGSFTLHHRKSRIGRNPKTGETIQIAASRLPSFKAGKSLKDKVNG